MKQKKLSKKYQAVEIPTDGDTKCSVSLASTTIQTANGEQRGYDKFCVSLSLYGEDVNAIFTKEQALELMGIILLKIEEME